MSSWMTTLTALTNLSVHSNRDVRTAAGEALSACLQEVCLDICTPINFLGNFVSTAERWPESCQTRVNGFWCAAAWIVSALTLWKPQESGRGIWETSSPRESPILAPNVLLLFLHTLRVSWVLNHVLPFKSSRCMSTLPAGLR